MEAARRRRPQNFALYNLIEDVAEQHDRAAERPDLVRELRAEMDAFQFPDIKK